MFKTHRPGKRAIVVGLLVAAVACGTAAAAVPALWVNVHARLAPVAGTTATGRFTGMLRMSFGTDRFEPSDNLPPTPAYSLLNWELSLPALRGPVSASLRLRPANGGAPVKRILCGRCSVAATGTLNLTVAQGLRIARPGAVIVVRTPSVTLRGPIKVSAQIMASATR